MSASGRMHKGQIKLLQSSSEVEENDFRSLTLFDFVSHTQGKETSKWCTLDKKGIWATRVPQSSRLGDTLQKDKKMQICGPEDLFKDFIIGDFMRSKLKVKKLMQITDDDEANYFW